jgi:multisite-specific tRNA:(cytosine-C5)-methyltransferase
MPILEGYVGEERVVRLYKRPTLQKLLIEMFPKVSDGGYLELGEIGDRVKEIGMGCCVLRIEPSNGPDGFDERMVIPLWRSMHSLNLMLAKEDRTALLLRIFNDTTPLVNNAIKKGSFKEEDLDSKQVAPGFKVEDGEVNVKVESEAIEASAPVNDRPVDGEVHPGPYSSVVAAPKNEVHSDIKAEKIVKDENTGGPEEQLNGTGRVEGQLSEVS